MDRASYARLQELFDAAMATPPRRRHALLVERCRDDAALLREAESMIAAVEPSKSFLEDSSFVFDLARRLEVVDGLDAGDAFTRGDLIGPWRIVGLLGIGGMGQVYSCERAEGGFQQQGALKVIKRGMDSDEILARFRNERQTLAQLDHPFIARLLDGGALPDGRPWLVMERVDGKRIDRWSTRHKLDLAARVELFDKVCSAVEHAHQRLVVHRDLKPSNILVNDSGDPKLLDFGIAKVLSGGAERTALTMTGRRALTVDWASPEQLRGRPITTASDLYSLGLLFYDLLCGVRPYDLKDCSPSEIDKIVCEDPVPRPSSTATLDPARRRELRGDLDNIVLQLLRKEPERRYATVSALRDDLDCWRRKLPVNAAAETTTYVLRKFVTRHRIEMLVATLMFVALVAVLFVSRRQTLAARADLLRAEQSLALLSTTLGSDGAEWSGGPTTSFADVIDRASRWLTDHPEVDPLVEAQVRLTLGSAFRAIHDDVHAKAELERALALCVQHGDADAPLAAAIRRQLALVRAERGE